MRTLLPDRRLPGNLLRHRQLRRAAGAGRHRFRADLQRVRGTARAGAGHGRSGGRGPSSRHRRLSQGPQTSGLKGERMAVMDFENRTVMVTGAGGNLGSAVAHAFERARRTSGAAGSGPRHAGRGVRRRSGDRAAASRPAGPRPVRCRRRNRRRALRPHRRAVQHRRRLPHGRAGARNVGPDLGFLMDINARVADQRGARRGAPHAEGRAAAGSSMSGRMPH